MQKSITILWDNQAKADLKLIFEFIKLKSPQGAKNVITDIVAQSKNIHFVEQYQVDEFLGEPFRRMIVRDYKVIYKIHSKNEIRILQIFDTRQYSIELKSNL
ncbi:type II toxin-antitoxin system RelE/ParE family toxin [Flavobacterium sp. LS2P90]|uniref:Type II toxin-antitoxin system RelE/ParE family toxin n=1 Tax=Flavobacterium xylosi TaxID=3230415 RepID=A0ABW6HXA1_9FLAO